MPPPSMVARNSSRCSLIASTICFVISLSPSFNQQSSFNQAEWQIYDGRSTLVVSTGVPEKPWTYSRFRCGAHISQTTSSSYKLDFFHKQQLWHSST